MFSTVLIANRGEIACRVMRTCQELGIRTVAVHSDADADAPHVLMADTAVRLGPAEARASYLNIPAVIDAARRTGAEAIHPGYGFLAENAEFARACAAAGIVFIGPPVGAIETMGDKIAARAAVEARSVATVPGLARPGLSDADLIAGAEQVGFPILIKPAAGGGGKGMHRVDDPAQLPELLMRARREASAGFGDDTLFIERFVTNPRHIEVQVLADTHGNVVHLGERECSLQRRHQKIIEEAPSPLLSPEQRHAIGEAACQTARSVDYVGAGTVEFIVSADSPDEPFFMEMNTRLQVEHPVTEMVTGVDLVEQQLRIAAGEHLMLDSDDLSLHGHAVEARIYAEDPAAGFLPTGGTVLELQWPEDSEVRVDAGIDVDSEVTSFYDPMLAKVIAHAPTRTRALERLDAALAHTALLGLDTNISFLRALLAHPAVREGNLDTGLVDRGAETLAQRTMPAEVPALAALHVWAQSWAVAAFAPGPWQQPSGWRLGAQRPSIHQFVRPGAGPQEAPIEVRITGTPDAAQVSVDGGEPLAASVPQDRFPEVIVLDGVEQQVLVATSESDDGDTVWVSHQGSWGLGVYRRPRGSIDGATTPTLEAPMPGAVVHVAVESGTRVEPGDAVVSVEAMKMEHVVRATIAGTVEVGVAVGDQVGRGQILARVTPNQE